MVGAATFVDNEIKLVFFKKEKIELTACGKRRNCFMKFNYM